MDTLIVSGGDLNKEFVKEFLDINHIDTIITADRGLQILDELKIMPDYVLGDFDSVNREVLNQYTNESNTYDNYENKKENKKATKIIRLNPIKDFTDTHEALKLAIENGSKNIYILGALGKRFDHALANVHVLKEALDKNIECKIIDSKNEISLITTGITMIEKDEIDRGQYKYISLIPLTTEVTGITLKGFKYPLENSNLEIGHSIGVSNELIGKIGTIEIEKGIMVLIKSKD